MSNKNKVSTARVTKPAPAKKMFETNDLGCAAALICTGHDLLYIADSKCEAHPGKLFGFFCAAGLAEVTRSYRVNTLVLPVRSYFDTIEMLTKKFYNNGEFN